MKHAYNATLQESYAQAESSTEDALSSSRQQGIQSPPVSFAPEEKMDSSLPEPQQEELRTPGLDSSTGALVWRGKNAWHGWKCATWRGKGLA